jgi:light-regulated signal transduction histidine kinase (bacteriophytochrome)
LGGRPGFLVTILIALLWSFAQGYEGYAADRRTFFLDGAVHLFVFVLIYRLIYWVHQGAMLLEKQSKELVRSNEELEFFAERAAHDLQAPLATILGFTELLKEKYQDSEDAATKDFTERIINNVKRMSVFIKALLNYANVKKPEISTPSVELEKVVKEVIEAFRFLILEKKAEVICDPLPVIQIDPGLAGLLFQNLIGNAMKYCEKEPRIHISSARRGKEWLFSIQDNGIGIPAGSRERVFGMFEKLETRKKYPGSGIGLATCQKIVERYGGRIWVESPPKDARLPSFGQGSVQGSAAENPGEGSTFFFTLPAA